MSKIDGGSLEWHGQEFFLLATRGTVTGMKKAAIYTQGVARKMIGGTGSGRTYRRGKSGKVHTASAPGQPPARDTGILTSSVSYDVKVKGPVVTGRIGPDVDKIKGRAKTSDPEYGLYLELGTRNMKRRPWLVPSVIKATPRIIRILRKAVGGLI